MINTSVAPFFDDFDPTKGFNKILFNPARPVQARELTQIQSILQHQIKHNGDFVFKNGSVVLPGHVFYDDKVFFIKLDTVYNQTNIESYLKGLVGSTITGATSGVSALLVSYDLATATDPTTIYIKYTSGNGLQSIFTPAEVLESNLLSGIAFKIATVPSYTGNAAICTIDNGIYYINGYFVDVVKQTVTVSKYSNTSSAVVGLNYVEEIVTSAQDASLFDNANGFSNYGAPGADRLKATLTLAVVPYSYTATDTNNLNFIELLKVNAGVIEKLSNDTQFAAIESLVAKRGFETNGNYVTKPFKFTASNYRSNNRSQWISNTPYLQGDIVTNAGNSYIALTQGYSGTVAPVQTFGVQSDGIIYWSELPNTSNFINDGTTQIASAAIVDHITADANMVITTSPGIAFVNGYENNFSQSTQSIVSKARGTTQLNQAQIYAPAGTYVLVTALNGLPNITTNLTKVSLLDISGVQIGTAFVRSFEFFSGSLTTPSTVQYQLFLFDISLSTGKNFTSHVHSISSASFAANIVNTTLALTGSVSAAGTTITGVGTYFNLDLSVGDRVQIGSIFTSVSSIVSPTSFIASSSVTATNAVIYKATSSLVKLGDYIQPLTSTAIATLRNSTGAIDMTYVVSKYYSFTASSTSYAITLTGGETFQNLNHIVIDNTGTLSTSIPVNATFTLNSGATTLTISGLTSGHTYNTLLIVQRTGNFAKEKMKSIATNTITLTNTGSQTYLSKLITLANADCTRIIKVTESGDAANKTSYVSSGETDVTTYFTLDNGQKAEFYDVGRISTQRSNNRPLIITYEYYIHSSGDYFSADSYSSIPEVLIGSTNIGGVNYYLPDYLDFRSSISGNGVDFNSANGASISDPLVSELTLSTSYSYFNPREDSNGVDVSGKIVYNFGQTFTNGMQLAKINIAANTLTPSVDVTFTDVQINTFTMKDIKSIDSRLSNAEFYIALSKAEKDAVNTTIVDQFGIPVTKNGYLVDSFNSFDVSDVYNSDWAASIDTTNSICSSINTMQGATFIEPLGTTNSSRLANGYQVTGSQVTLPYVEVPMISQTLASTAEVIQAYANIDFTGIMRVYPSMDSYVDNVYNTITNTTVLAPVTNYVNCNYSSGPGFLGLFGSGSFWNPLPVISGGSIICTKLHELGFISDETYSIDEEYGNWIRTNDPYAYIGYLVWAKYIVSGMDKSYKFAKVVNFIAKPWMTSMTHFMKYSDKKSFIGAAMIKIGLPICRIIGKIKGIK